MFPNFKVTSKDGCYKFLEKRKAKVFYNIKLSLLNFLFSLLFKKGMRNNIGSFIILFAIFT
ncbi:hypothetical protein CCYN2B_20011 [Capnocytophaga cynodegmi]|uniref:Uncharacterized protein n=1 Tax=Capnocytophaga cynodegmi TaxID=28189 RepID=A0A0B7H6I7_9FLAO|nr:hypothetical protein CCYN2B_20011 [Capnocytophaga cynodegmi]